jgi:hypothetical protein
MLAISRSSKKANRGFAEVARAKGEGNVAWLARSGGGVGGGVRLLLFGGVDLASTRLRIAQSHARDDLTPSHWSHVAIVVADGPLEADTPLFEVRLEPPGGLSSLVARNGVIEGKLADYDAADRYPNVALLGVPVKADDMAAAIKRFYHVRHVADGIGLAIAWLDFVCGVGRTPNPLLAGEGIPSAVFVEMVVAAAGFELTPGLPNRSSCPEAIWQAAKFWHGEDATSAASAGGGTGAEAKDNDSKGDEAEPDGGQGKVEVVGGSWVIRRGGGVV